MDMTIEEFVDCRVRDGCRRRREEGKNEGLKIDRVLDGRLLNDLI